MYREYIQFSQTRKEILSPHFFIKYIIYCVYFKIQIKSSYEQFIYFCYL